MSKFLGPIHYWLYNKIKIHEAIEQDLLSALGERHNYDQVALAAEAIENFGPPLNDEPLENLIDTGNIHGWLQNKIAIAETRQAYIITESFKREGQAVLNTFEDIFKHRGLHYGKEAALQSKPDTPDAMYKVLNNHILEGMPCDNVNSITQNTEDLVEWKTTSCLHEQYWDQVGGNINYFYKLRHAFIRGFITAGNDGFSYEIDIAKGDDNILMKHTIKRK